MALALSVPVLIGFATIIGVAARTTQSLRRAILFGVLATLFYFLAFFGPIVLHRSIVLVVMLDALATFLIVGLHRVLLAAQSHASVSIWLLGVVIVGCSVTTVMPVLRTDLQRSPWVWLLLVFSVGSLCGLVVQEFQNKSSTAHD